MDENKWEELSEVQTDYLGTARSEITDDTEISFATVSFSPIIIAAVVRTVVATVVATAAGSRVALFSTDSFKFDPICVEFKH